MLPVGFLKTVKCDSFRWSWYWVVSHDITRHVVLNEVTDRSLTGKKPVLESPRAGAVELQVAR